MTNKLLFILKYRDAAYTDENYNCGGLSSGLLNSASFISNELPNLGIDAKLIQVIDNNCIDKEVTKYKPTHVIIEAYWVVPDKFAILTKLHPNIKWIIRNHSEIPFLATEGIAIDWTLEYLKYPNVYVSANSDRALHEMQTMAVATYGFGYENRVVYLPNFYKSPYINVVRSVNNSNTIKIGCFGAIRPLKNQLLQAVAAIDFANKYNKKLEFHINYSRIEGGGNNALKNIQALFKHIDPNKYKLVEHTWMPHKSFVDLCKKMDIVLCVSFTETFCIVAADCVGVDTPVVASSEVRWTVGYSQADPTSSEDIVSKMSLAWNTRKTGILQWLNKSSLNHNVELAKKQWVKLFYVKSKIK